MSKPKLKIEEYVETLKVGDHWNPPLMFGLLIKDLKEVERRLAKIEKEECICGSSAIDHKEHADHCGLGTKGDG